MNQHIGRRQVSHSTSLLVFRHEKPVCMPITFCPSMSFQLVATCCLPVTFCCFGLVEVGYNSFSWTRRLVSTAQFALSLGRTLYHCFSAQVQVWDRLHFCFWRLSPGSCFSSIFQEAMLRSCPVFLPGSFLCWLLHGC